MPAKKPRTPAYCLHRPSGRAYVRLAGRLAYLGKAGSDESRAEYDRIIAEWLVGGRSAPRAGPGRTVAELLAAYWTFAEGYYGKDGRGTDEATNIRYALAPVRRRYSKIPAVQFGPLALKTVRQSPRAGQLPHLPPGHAEPRRYFAHTQELVHVRYSVKATGRTRRAPDNLSMPPLSAGSRDNDLRRFVPWFL